jgi:hypothetical protein
MWSSFPTCTEYFEHCVQTMLIYIASFGAEFKWSKNTTWQKRIIYTYPSVLCRRHNDDAYLWDFKSWLKGEYIILPVCPKLEAILKHPRTVFNHNHHHLVSYFNISPQLSHSVCASATGKTQAQHIFLITEEWQYISNTLFQFINCSWSWS